MIENIPSLVAIISVSTAAIEKKCSTGDKSNSSSNLLAKNTKAEVPLAHFSSEKLLKNKIFINNKFN